MKSISLFLTVSVLIASPVIAQQKARPGTKASAKPTKVIAKSDQLVTARAPNGNTRSYNCRKPANAKRAVCKR